MAINLPQYFKSHVEGGTTEIFPIVVIGPDRSQLSGNNNISKYLFLSTNDITIKYAGKESNGNTIFENTPPPIDILFRGMLLDVSSIKESINLERRKHSISNTTISIANDIYKNKSISYYLSKYGPTNHEIFMYYATPITDNWTFSGVHANAAIDAGLNYPAVLIYQGKVKKTQFNDTDIKITAEDKTQDILSQDIHKETAEDISNRLGTTWHSTDSDKNLYPSMCYGHNIKNVPSINLYDNGSSDPLEDENSQQVSKSYLIYDKRKDVNTKDFSKKMIGRREFGTSSVKIFDGDSYSNLRQFSDIDEDIYAYGEYGSYDDTGTGKNNFWYKTYETVGSYVKFNHQYGSDVNLGRLKSYVERDIDSVKFKYYQKGNDWGWKNHFYTNKSSRQVDSNSFWAVWKDPSALVSSNGSQTGAGSVNAFNNLLKENVTNPSSRKVIGYRWANDFTGNGSFIGGTAEKYAFYRFSVKPLNVNADTQCNTYVLFRGSNFSGTKFEDGGSGTGYIEKRFAAPVRFWTGSEYNLGQLLKPSDSQEEGGSIGTSENILRWYPKKSHIDGWNSYEEYDPPDTDIPEYLNPVASNTGVWNNYEFSYGNGDIPPHGVGVWGGNGDTVIPTTRDAFLIPLDEWQTPSYTNSFNVGVCPLEKRNIAGLVIPQSIDIAWWIHNLAIFHVLVFEGIFNRKYYIDVQDGRKRLFNSIHDVQFQEVLEKDYQVISDVILSECLNISTNDREKYIDKDSIKKVSQLENVNLSFSHNKKESAKKLLSDMSMYTNFIPYIKNGKLSFALTDKSSYNWNDYQDSKTINQADVVSYKTSISPDHENLYNKIKIKYLYDSANKDYFHTYSYTSWDIEDQGINVPYYGLEEDKTLELNCPYISNETEVEKSIKILTKIYSFQSAKVELVLPVSYIGLEVGDLIRFKDLASPLGGSGKNYIDYTNIKELYLKEDWMKYYLLPLLQIESISKSIKNIKITLKQVIGNITNDFKDNFEELLDELNIDYAPVPFIPTTPIVGCTDSTALNYNPNAEVDDGTCVLPIYGCTNPLALNYNIDANTDNGSCEFPTGDYSAPKTLVSVSNHSVADAFNNSITPYSYYENYFIHLTKLNWGYEEGVNPWEQFEGLDAETIIKAKFKELKSWEDNNLAETGGDTKDISWRNYWQHIAFSYNDNGSSSNLIDKNGHTPKLYVCLAQSYDNNTESSAYNGLASNVAWYEHFSENFEAETADSNFLTDNANFELSPLYSGDMNNNLVEGMEWIFGIVYGYMDYLLMNNLSLSDNAWQPFSVMSFKGIDWISYEGSPNFDEADGPYTDTVHTYVINIDRYLQSQDYARKFVESSLTTSTRSRFYTEDWDSPEWYYWGISEISNIFKEIVTITDEIDVEEFIIEQIKSGTQIFSEDIRQKIWDIVSERYQVYSYLNCIARAKDSTQESYDGNDILGNSDFGHYLKIKIYNPVDMNPWLKTIKELLSTNITFMFTPTQNDVDVVAKHIVGIEQMSESQISFTDSDNDGIIDLKDLNATMGIVYNATDEIENLGDKE